MGKKKPTSAEAHGTSNSVPSPPPASLKRRRTRRGKRPSKPIPPSDLARATLAAAQKLFATANPQPLEVIGIVDAMGAVHGVPKFGGHDAMLIHTDVFTTCQKRWRYRPKQGERGAGAFATLPDCDGLAEYILDEEETEHVRQFLGRRGWL